MERHCSIVPYHDPTDDTSSTDQILMFDNENPCLGFAEFPEIPEPCSRHSAMLYPESNYAVVDTNNNTNIILDPDDPLSDQFIWGLINNDSSGCNVAAGNYEAVDSGINVQSMIGQGNNLINCNFDIPQISSGFGNPIQLSIWPVPPSPYNCSCCHILREIIHINGQRVSNLEIHGRLGIISHGVLDRYEMDLSSKSHEYQMFDFCNESIENVKNFLVQYCQDRKREGYIMVHDPLSMFYETLCVGLNEKEDHHDDVFCQPFSKISGVSQTGNGKMKQQVNASLQNAEINGSRQDILTQNMGEESRRGPAKSSLATQRERTGKLKLKDLSQFFHLPINDAAKRMKVCPTVIKKKCRQGGLSRWPYRKIKGIKRKIAMKQESLTAVTAEERGRVLAEIQTLKQKLENIFIEHRKTKCT